MKKARLVPFSGDFFEATGEAAILIAEICGTEVGLSAIGPYTQITAEEARACVQPMKKKGYEVVVVPVGANEGRSHWQKDPREETLPKWAQERLTNLRQEIDSLQALRKANDVLQNHKWFTIPGPTQPKGPDYFVLFTLYDNGAQAVCELGRGDVLLIGRKRED